MGKTWVSRAPYPRKNRILWRVHLLIYTRVDKALLQVPSVSHTKKLPGVVLFHQNMRGRFTTLIQQPFAVQDVEFTIVGFDPDPADAGTKSRLLSTSSETAEWPCRLMPKAIYVKIDDCDYQFLPPSSCSLHSNLVMMTSARIASLKYSLASSQ